MVADEIPIAEDDVTASGRIAEAVANPRVVLAPKNISEYTGIRASEVVRLVQGVPYRTALMIEALQSMARSVRALENMVIEKRSSLPNKIAAHRAIVDTFKVMMSYKVGDGEDPDMGLGDWARKHTNNSGTNHGSAGRTHPDPKAKEGRRAGSDPAS